MAKRLIFGVVFFVVASIFSSGVFADASGYKLERSDGFSYELIVTGENVESVTLKRLDGIEFKIADIGVSVFLPPGLYTVEKISFPGGNVFSPSVPRNTLTFNAESPTPLDLSIKPTPEVKRAGGLLTLDYTLLDGEGRKYTADNRLVPPGFVIKRGEREIFSGSFEYG
jgi:hypothetical protein